jgi:antitoxin YefM
MDIATFTAFRRNMASYLDRVAESREPLVITRQSGRCNVVVMSEAEFAGWQETVHLLSSPRNAERLMESIREVRAGNTQERELLVPKADIPSP